MSGAEIVVAILIALIPIALAVINVLKGKPWFALLGFFLFGIFGVVGAIRLAKPNSPWAQRYDRDKLVESMGRFPKHAAKRDPEWTERLDAQPSAFDHQWPAEDPMLWDKITRKAYKREHGHWPEQAPQFTGEDRTA